MTLTIFQPTFTADGLTAVRVNMTKQLQIIPRHYQLTHKMLRHMLTADLTILLRSQISQWIRQLKIILRQ